MKRNKQERNATPEGIVRYACERENEAIVYDDFAGFPVKVTFLDDRWWVTTPGEPLVPLDEYIDGEDVGYVFLCGPDGRVGALALAKLLGKALTNPEDKVDEVLRQRIKSLQRLGAKLDVKDEPLTVQLEVFAKKPNSHRQGKYSMWCHLAGNFCEMLFDIDSFETKKEAEKWAVIYFDLLEELGIDFSIINK